MTSKGSHRFLANDAAALGTRSVLKAARIAVRALVVIGSALLIVAVYLVADSFLARRKAAQSSDWPTADGQIVSSEVASSSARGYRERFETRYRAEIVYSYRVDGKRYQSGRIRFTGDESSGSRTSVSRQDAEAEAKQYPPEMRVRVYYDPADPVEAVLEPGLAHYDPLQLYGPGFFVLLAFILAVIVPFAIKQAARKVVAWLAEKQPYVWEVASEYGVQPPSNFKGLAPESVKEWVVEARHTLQLKGRRVMFEVGPCTVHTEGDFTGNLDLPLRTRPVLPEQEILDNLCLKVPDYDRLLGVVASGETTQGLEFIFSLSDIASELALQRGEDTVDVAGWQRQTAAALTAVEVLWGRDGQTKVGSVPCVCKSQT